MVYKRLEQVALAVFLLLSNKGKGNKTMDSVSSNRSEMALYHYQNKQTVIKVTITD